MGSPTLRKQYGEDIVCALWKHKDNNTDLTGEFED